jgi:hypothetical protein
MFIVRNFELWRVDQGIVRSKKGEADSEEERETN